MQKRARNADKIIHDYTVRSGMTGFIPIPLVDTLSLIGVQRLMLYRLSKLYGVPFKKNVAKIALTTLMGGAASTMASPVLGSMIKLIPGVGSLAGGASMAALGSAATYAVGKVFQQHFENGGTLDDFDPEKSREIFDEKLEKGIKLTTPAKSAKN